MATPKSSEEWDISWLLYERYTDMIRLLLLSCKEK